MLTAFAKGETSILDELVFPSPEGSVLDPDNLVKRYFLPAIERAGLRRFRFHDLRHTFGSLLIQRGASPSLCKGANGTQLHPDNGGHVRTFDPRRKCEMGRWVGPRYELATNSNSAQMSGT